MTINATIIDDLHTLKVYPNPANNILYIEYNAPVESILLMNNMGKLFKQKSDKISSAFTLDISNIPSGLYTLYLNGNTAIHQKIVISH